MTYMDSGRTIHVGDQVEYFGTPGIIVFVIDDDMYSDGFDKKNWSYLEKGFGIVLQDGTLFHLDSPDEDLVEA